MLEKAVEQFGDEDWDTISATLLASGLNRSAEQCDDRWNTKDGKKGEFWSKEEVGHSVV
jgi:hypothetical protein